MNDPRYAWNDTAADSLAHEIAGDPDMLRELCAENEALDDTVRSLSTSHITEAARYNAIVAALHDLAGDELDRRVELADETARDDEDCALAYAAEDYA